MVDLRKLDSELSICFIYFVLLVNITVYFFQFRKMMRTPLTNWVMMVNMYKILKCKKKMVNLISIYKHKSEYTGNDDYILLSYM